MRAIVPTAVVLLVPLAPLAPLAACSSDPAASAPATKLSDDYRRMGDKLGSAIALLKSGATTAETVTPADFASVARVPKAVTGNVDITVEQKGKTGEKASDIDAIGAEETVSIFVPDAPTGGTGTTASLPSFAAWKGDADSSDTGLCYLAFSKSTDYFVVSKCGDASGAWVCQVTSSETSCNACNTAGDCQPCDMTQPKFTCAW